MSLKLYLDDCAFSYRLRQLLIDVDLVRSIANLQRLGIPLAGGFWPLNAYQW